MAVFAALGADRAAARVFGAPSGLARLVSGILYISSPIWATELDAGHLPTLVSSAFIPWGFCAAYSMQYENGPSAKRGAAICAAGMLAQMQTGLMFLFAMPFFMWRRRARDWLDVWVIALASWMPVAFAAYFALSSPAFAAEQQLRVWTSDQSVPWKHILDGTSYFAGYFDKAAGRIARLLWEITSPCCFLLAIISGKHAKRLALIAAAFGVVATGTSGPLRWMMVAVFEHVPAASLFRELYNLLAFVPLVVCGGASIAVQYVLNAAWHLQWRAISFLCLAMVFLGMSWPALAARAAANIPLANPQTWQPLATAAAATAGSGRILWLPSWVPLGPRNTPGGSDPFEAPFGNHPTVQAYNPYGLFAYASAIADRTGRLPQWLTQKLAIEYVGVRTGVVSDRLQNKAHPYPVTVTPYNETSEEFPGASALAIARNAQCEPDLWSSMEAHQAYILCEESPLFLPREDPSATQDDPHTEWVQAERWLPLDPTIGDSRWPTMVTTSNAVFAWSVTSKGRVLIYAPQGGWLDHRALPASRAWHTQMIRSGPHEVRSDRGHLIAISASLRPSYLHPAQSKSIEHDIAIAHQNRAAVSYEATLPPHDSGIIILREGWSPFWHARIGDSELGPPILADGYASGWYVPAGRSTTHLLIFYAPAYPYYALLVISFAIWATLSGLNLQAFWRRTYRR